MTVRLRPRGIARSLAGLLVAMALSGCGSETEDSSATSRSGVASVMSAPAETGFVRATLPGSLEFPRDHGPHPDYRSEWWYFTGNLADSAGRQFGFQLTLFRFALAANKVVRTSRFATRQVWMGHFAVTDLEAGQFHAFERFARGAAGLAGATASPMRVWVEDWRVQAVGHVVAEAGKGADSDPFPLHLQAARDGVAVNLLLLSGRPRVLQGEAGLSRKNAGPGNASFYYSYTRLPARGTIRVGAQDFEVSGNAWMDREWSTSALAPDQVGWDWFALHLDDGRDLMFYQLRDTRGAMHPFSAGVIVGEKGLVRRLGADQVRLQPLTHWRSPDGARYPMRWALQAEDLDLTVHTVVSDQEHRGNFRYWEGAVRAEGNAGATPISGSGYLEMTGY